MRFHRDASFRRLARELGLLSLFLLTLNAWNAAPSRADSTLPILDFAEATGLPATLVIVPDGSGPSLADIGVSIRLRLVDPDGLPIAGFPFQDMTLVGDDPASISICVGGSAADGNTNGNGIAFITGPIAGGGSSDAGVRVSLSGDPSASPVLGLTLISPDYDGDLAVGIVDIYVFSVDYLGGSYVARSDFDQNGSLNIGDLGFLAQHVGTSCP